MKGEKEIGFKMIRVSFWPLSSTLMHKRIKQMVRRHETHFRLKKLLKPSRQAVAHLIMIVFLLPPWSCTFVLLTALRWNVSWNMKKKVQNNLKDLFAPEKPVFSQWTKSFIFCLSQFSSLSCRMTAKLANRVWPQSISF